MTRYRLFALVVCFGVAIAGCNSSGSTSNKAKSSPTPSPTPMTAAQAQLLAAAGVVAPADLPGYTSKAQTADPTDVAREAKFDQCLGVPTVTFLAKDLGKAYIKADREIDSSARVATTVEMAKAEGDAAAGTKGTDCFKQAILSSAGSDITNPQVSITPHPVTVAGADVAIVYELGLSGTSQGQTVQIHGSQAFAIVGQTILDVGGFAQSPPALSTDELVALLTKAADRVKAAA